jgi:hypothetical protein
MPVGQICQSQSCLHAFAIIKHCYVNMVPLCMHVGMTVIAIPDVRLNRASYDDANVCVARIQLFDPVVVGLPARDPPQ